MANEYTLNLKARLDTTEVDAKLQSLGSTSSLENLDQSLSKLNAAVDKLAQSLDKVGKNAQTANMSLGKMKTAAAALLATNVMQNAAQLNPALGTGLNIAMSGVQGAVLGNMLGYGVGGAIFGAGAAGVGAIQDWYVQNQLNNINARRQVLTDAVSKSTFRATESQALELEDYKTNLTGMSESELKAAIDTANKTRAAYAETIRSGRFDMSEAPYLKQEKEYAELRAKLAQTELESRKKAAEAAEKIKELEEKRIEAIRKTADNAYSEAAFKQQLNSYQGLGLPELQNIQKANREQLSKLEADYMAQLRTAEQSGKQEDLDKANEIRLEGMRAGAVNQTVSDLINQKLAELNPATQFDPATSLSKMGMYMGENPVEDKQLRTQEEELEVVRRIYEKMREDKTSKSIFG